MTQQEYAVRADALKGRLYGMAFLYLGSQSLAVDAITGMPCSLESYNLKAVTEGQDALGEVTVRVRHGEDTMLGRGVSTDILEASCLSYLNAVNRLIAHREELARGEDASAK